MITPLGQAPTEIVNKRNTSPLDPGTMPGLIPKPDPGALDFNKLVVRYAKLDMDELSDITELEKIETKAYRNQGVYVLSKKEFTFMDKMFILIGYMEEANTSSSNEPSGLGISEIK